MQPSACTISNRLEDQTCVFGAERKDGELVAGGTHGSHGSLQNDMRHRMH